MGRRKTIDWHGDPEYRRKYLREYNRKNFVRLKEWRIGYMLQRKFGISKEEYDRMFVNQNGRCAICRRPPKKFRLSVDHDHKTGKVRGLLCAPCNKVLGYVENVQWMEETKKYLASRA